MLIEEELGFEGETGGSVGLRQTESKGQGYWCVDSGLSVATLRRKSDGGSGSSRVSCRVRGASLLLGAGSSAVRFQEPCLARGVRLAAWKSCGAHAALVEQVRGRLRINTSSLTSKE